MPETNEPSQRLTEADAERIAEAVKSKLLEDFYRDLGEGVWTILWRALVVVLLAVAAVGAVKSGDGGIFH